MSRHLHACSTLGISNFLILQKFLSLFSPKSILSGELVLKPNRCGGVCVTEDEKKLK